MVSIKEKLGSELTFRRMNNLCSKLLEETVSSTNALIGVDFAVPEWFAIFEGESLSQIKEKGVDTNRYKIHLENLMKSINKAVYGYEIVGVKFPKILTKGSLVSLLNSMFHEYLHYINDQFWQETDKSLYWSGRTWAKEAIAERTVFEHLHHLYKDEFLISVQLTPKDFEVYNNNRIQNAKPDSTAKLLLIYLVDAIANSNYVYGKGKDLFLDSIKDENFDPIKSRFNLAVGGFEDSIGKYEDAFKYLVNAPIPQIALYAFIKQKKNKEFNGKNLAQYIKEAKEIGYSAKNIKLLKDGEAVKAEYDYQWDRDFY